MDKAAHQGLIFFPFNFPTAEAHGAQESVITRVSEKTQEEGNEKDEKG